MKPSGNRPRWRISSGVMAASLSQVTPAGSFTRTPPCTGFLPPDIMTPGHRPVGEIIAPIQQVRLSCHDLRLLCFVIGLHLGKRPRRQRAIGGARRKRGRMRQKLPVPSKW